MAALFLCGCLFLSGSRFTAGLRRTSLGEKKKTITINIKKEDMGNG